MTKFWIILFLLATASCNVKEDFSSSQNKDKRSQIQASDAEAEVIQDPNDDDVIAEPAMVGGAFLNCAIDEKYGARAFQGAIGCRVENHDGPIPIGVTPIVKSSQGTVLEITTLPSHDYWQWKVPIDFITLSESPEDSVFYEVSFNGKSQKAAKPANEFKLKAVDLVNRVVDTRSGEDQGVSKTLHDLIAEIKIRGSQGSLPPDPSASSGEITTINRGTAEAIESIPNLTQNKPQVTGEEPETPAQEPEPQQPQPQVEQEEQQSIQPEALPQEDHFQIRLTGNLCFIANETDDDSAGVVTVGTGNCDDDGVLHFKTSDKGDKSMELIVANTTHQGKCLSGDPAKADLTSGTQVTLEPCSMPSHQHMTYHTSQGNVHQIKPLFSPHDHDHCLYHQDGSLSFENCEGNKGPTDLIFQKVN